ncbi:unnamed protein product [Sphagnum jensenii]|uniref:Protein kinase domain-containing protein n=2 Tax=Sphagnum jensenii TaxID=128206 RepID=A0ABP1AVC0_9BRYO
MAGITGHILTMILLLFSILATGGLESVAAAAAYYRPQFFAIQNRHFGPHSVIIATAKDQALLTWIHGLNPRMMSSIPEMEKQFFGIVPSRPNNKHGSLLSSRKLPMPLVSRSSFPVKVVERLKGGPGGQEANFTSNDRMVKRMLLLHRQVSHRWFLMLLLVPAALLFLAVSICLYKVCRRSKYQVNQFDTQLSKKLSRSKLFGPWLSFKGSIAGGRCLSSARPIAYLLLHNATDNFSSSNLLGKGSFSRVYKAKLDHDVFAAVKRLEENGKQGEIEFQAEVGLMSKIRHPNLVSLLGFSSDGPERLLVYELMENGSLHDQLHGPSHGSGLTWHLRLKIALQAARGLEHLHEHCKPAVIHRDFKASNILLDAGFNAKVSDFGLALVKPVGSMHKDSVQVQGTFGYVAPEYLMNGSLTEKSDVYGFGVVLLELLTGRLPMDSLMPLGSQSLVTWAMPLLSDKAKVLEIVDPYLQDTVNLKHLYQVAAVVKLCVQPEPSYRPLITDVLQSLLPLVPIELGGAWRDTKARKTRSAIQASGSPI